MSCAGSRISNALPARAPQSAASGVGAQAQPRLQLQAAALASSAARRALMPANRCRLPRTSSSSPSGGSRLTRGVKRCARSASARELRPCGAARQMHAHPQLGRSACRARRPQPRPPRAAARGRGAGRGGGAAGAAGTGMRPHCAAHSSRQNARARRAARLQQRDAHGRSLRLQPEPQHRAEASRAARRGRNRTPSVRPCSAASCRRRVSRGCGCRAQASAASQAPERSACSKAHSGRAPPTTATRSSTTPRGDQGRRKGHQRRRHPHAPARRGGARQRGERRQQQRSSPLPKRATRISIRPLRGQPRPGRCSSSAAKPVGKSRRLRAALRPRQMAGCSSNRAMFGSPCHDSATNRMPPSVLHAGDAQFTSGRSRGRGAPRPRRCPR